MKKSIHSTDYAVFLRTLKAARQDAGLSQVQLARAIKETQTFVSKYERGERRLDVVELRTICRAFGLDLKQFVVRFERELGRQ